MIADTEAFWDYIRETTDAFQADVVLADGDRVRAGGRDLRVVARPGHSTTDALLVDERDADRVRRRPPPGHDLLQHGDLPGRWSRTGTRPRARVEYLESLRAHAAMPLARLLTGHGADDHRHAGLVRTAAGRPRAPLRAHRRRARRPATATRVRDRRRAVVASGRSSSSRCSSSGRSLGHLDLLLDAGASSEHGDARTVSTYGVAILRRSPQATTRPLGGGRSCASQPRPP